MVYKKGDKVRIKKNIPFGNRGYASSMRVYSGMTAKVCSVEIDKWVTLEETSHWYWDPDWLDPVIIDNKLNRKLYPNYEESEGYLLPKTSDKLSEEV